MVLSSQPLYSLRCERLRRVTGGTSIGELLTELMESSASGRSSSSTSLSSKEKNLTLNN